MELQDFCNEYLLDEKLFIVPTRSIGMQVINNMSREGYPSINLKAVTLKGLAFEICEEYLENNVELIVDNIIGTNLIIEILKELSNKYPHNFFFTSNLIDSKTSEEVYKAIMELKYGNIDKFPNIKNLDQIYSEYKKKLNELKAVDNCDILKLATLDENIGTYQSKIIGVASNIETNNIERIFLEKLTGENGLRIEMPVKILDDYPKNYYFKNKPDSESLENKKVKFYNSYGSMNEIDYIIKDIKTRRIPIDEVVIAYTNNKYADLINIEFEKANIPITFGDGLGIETSSVYRFIRTIFTWAKKYYNLNEIRPIFANGDVNTEGASAPAIYEELIQRRIIFGKENYYKKLDLYNIEHGDKTDYKSIKINWIKQFFGDLFQAIPENMVEFNKYIPQLINLITKYVKNINKYDGAARVVVLETLNTIEYINMEVTKDEYFDIVLSYIENSQILRTQAQPGNVFAINYRVAGYTGRKNLYLIGMDSDSLSSKIVESPILLDLMKVQISDNLAFANESYSYKKYKIKELLTADFQSISIGYSNFDQVEVKPKSPSQIYNELKGLCITEFDEVKKGQGTILGRDIIKSGTGLEVLAECPRKAYLRYKLKIKELDDVDIQVDRWLDPMQRGLIVHKALDIYLNLDNQEQREEMLLKIVEELCQGMNLENVSVLQEVYTREKQDIFNICKNMIEITNIDPDWKLLVSELSFGYKDNKSNKIFGELPSQRILVQGLELEIMGAIDRIDVNKNAENVFRIIDYKTGSKKNFDKKLRVTSGRGANKEYDYSQTSKLQYYIYKKALEEILKGKYSNPIIKKFTYIFQDDSIDIEFDRDFIETIETRISDLLNMDVLKEQATVIYDPDDELRCKYCVYKSICTVDRKEILVEEEVEH